MRAFKIVDASIITIKLYSYIRVKLDLIRVLNSHATCLSPSPPFISDLSDSIVLAPFLDMAKEECWKNVALVAIFNSKSTSVLIYPSTLLHSADMTLNNYAYPHLQI